MSSIGWNAEVPPNGFANRPTTATVDNNNPLGLLAAAPDFVIETTPEHYRCRPLRWCRRWGWRAPPSIFLRFNLGVTAPDARSGFDCGGRSQDNHTDPHRHLRI
jgi:hypothetical protein